MSAPSTKFKTVLKVAFAIDLVLASLFAVFFTSIIHGIASIDTPVPVPYDLETYGAGFLAFLSAALSGGLMIGVGVLIVKAWQAFTARH
jgi:hypothetical protein